MPPDRPFSSDRIIAGVVFGVIQRSFAVARNAKQPAFIVRDMTPEEIRCFLIYWKAYATESALTSVQVVVSGDVGSGFAARYQADPDKSVFHYVNTSRRGLVYLAGKSDTVQHAPPAAHIMRDHMLLDGSLDTSVRAVDDIIRLVAEAVGFEERAVPGRIAGHIKTVLAANHSRHIPVRVFIRFCYSILADVYEEAVACAPTVMDGIAGRNLTDLGYFQDEFWNVNEAVGQVRDRLSENLAYVDLTDMAGESKDRVVLANKCREMWFKDTDGTAFPDHEQNRWRMLTERYCQDQSLDIRRKLPFFIMEQLFASGKSRFATRVDPLSTMSSTPAASQGDSQDSATSATNGNDVVIDVPRSTISWPGGETSEDPASGKPGSESGPKEDSAPAQSAESYEEPTDAVVDEEAVQPSASVVPVSDPAEAAMNHAEPTADEADASSVSIDQDDVEETISALSDLADTMSSEPVPGSPVADSPEAEAQVAAPKVPPSIPSLDELENLENLAGNRHGVLSFEELSARYQLILDTYKEFGIAVLATENIEESFVEGPASVLYRVRPGAGVDYRRIRDKADALKLALALEEDQNIRFSIDRGFVTIDVPKSDVDRFFVTALDLWAKWTFNDNLLSVPIGLDSLGNVVTINFSSSNSPHLLIAGTTGSGKSEALNTILGGLVNYYSPDRLRLLLVDPKGTELGHFGDSPFLEGEIGWDETDAIHLLDHAFSEMQGRYRTFRDAGKRSLQEYNGSVPTNQRLPWWLIVLDEYADLTSNTDDKKKIEQLLKRLAQKARAAGIHVIIATQKPSGDVISTNLRSNLPAQLALRVKSNTESRVIMDDNGAEALNGKGDAFLKCEGRVTRIQCAKT